MISHIGSDTEVNFQNIKQKYRENPLPILRQLVGNGEIQGKDYVALNPTRNDRHHGSFRIDIATGRFYDFATYDKGGSIIDLAAFVYNCGIIEAARRLQQLFPFLACESVVVDTVSARKKKLDPKYIWKLSTVSQHEYLNRKKVTIGNARINIYKERAQLVIPLTDIIPEKKDDLDIKGLQFIDEDGHKIFPMPFKGLFHIASDYERSKKRIIVSEGYATARSIEESTDFFVIAAMSSLNMKFVAEKIAEQFPNAEIVIAADNDEAGRRAVIEAKRAVSKTERCRAVYPAPEFNDFNDMYQAIGADGLREFFSELDTRK